LITKQKRLGWIAEYVIYRCLETGFRLLPVSLCYRIGMVLGRWSFQLLPKRRTAVIRNLTIAYGDKLEKSEIITLAKEVFSCNGGNLISVIKTATMSREAIEACVEIEGGEQIETFAKENDGCILILPHMGNWEIGARLNEITYGDRLSGALYRPLNNPLMDNLVKQRRESSKTSLFARSHGVSAPLKLIRKKGVLGILADQRAGKAGIITPFFGRLTSFAPPPEIYKKRTACGLMSLSIETISPGRWKAIYKVEACKKTDISTADVAVIIENLMDVSPKDCFWMQDRWRLEKKPLMLQGKQPIQYPRVLHSSTIKKHSFAIYLEAIPENDRPVIERLALHRPDIQLHVYTPAEQVLEHCNMHQAPALDSPEFEDFLSNALCKSFLDLLLLPQSYQAPEREACLTRIYPFDPARLAASLEALGLPESPYA
jgi:KDO2-lipid IV(A) lauroyltransferase